MLSPDGMYVELAELDPEPEFWKQILVNLPDPENIDADPDPTFLRGSGALEFLIRYLGMSTGKVPI